MNTFIHCPLFLNISKLLILFYSLHVFRSSIRWDILLAFKWQHVSSVLLEFYQYSKRYSQWCGLDGLEPSFDFISTSILLTC